MFPPCSMPSFSPIYSLSWRLCRVGLTLAQHAVAAALIMASATPCVSLCEAQVLTHLSKGAFEDSDLTRHVHKWPTR